MQYKSKKMTMKEEGERKRIRIAKGTQA